MKKFNLSITKIDEERIDEKIKIIPLTSPMKVRSPLGFRSSYNLSTEGYSTSNQLNVHCSSKIPQPTNTTHHQIVRRPSISNKEVQTMATSQENLRKPSILSLRSLSLSLRMIMPRALRESEEHIEPLKTIEETKMSTFRESEFQSYSKYTQQTQQKNRRFTIFKNQKIYDRRSSMSDIPDENNENNVNQRNLQMQHASTSATNVKHETHEHKKKHHKEKTQDKTAETLKEIRRRNLETAKRIQSAPRRISTAY